MMKKSILAICAFLLLGCSGEDPLAAGGDASQPDKEESVSRSGDSSVFEYPVIDWASFDTHAQKVAACAIPESLLPEIPTRELVALCMEYPLIFDAYAFDTPLIGLKTVASRFNGMQELLQRSDNCLCLFSYLKENDICKTGLAPLSLTEKGRLTMLYSLGEYLLAFDDVLKNASAALLREIAAFAGETLEHKESDALLCSRNGLTSSIYLCLGAQTGPTRALSADTAVDEFLATGRVRDAETYWELRRRCGGAVR